MNGEFEVRSAFPLYCAFIETTRRAAATRRKHMFKIFKTAALSALIGLGAFAAMPATAQAQSGGVYLGFGNQGPSVGMHFNDRGRHDVRDREYRERDYRDHRESRGRDRGCSVREALNKAERMGLRRVRVVDENRRVVRIEGRRAHGPRMAMIVFANERNCPVIR
jgi:hypothetical protein